MELFTNLTPYTTIVTPNRRLSAVLLKEYNHYQALQGNTCWESLDVLPFTSWIQRCWQTYCATHIEITPLILSAQQEQMVWEGILEQSPINDALLQLSATAELAKTAWGILKQWRVELDAAAFAATEDTSAFHQWAEAFQEKCRENNWLDTPRLLDLVCEKIMAAKIKLPPQIVLIGFTEYTPQQNHLFSVCASYGTTITYFSGYFKTKPSLTSRQIALDSGDGETVPQPDATHLLISSSASLSPQPGLTYSKPTDLKSIDDLSFSSQGFELTDSEFVKRDALTLQHGSSRSSASAKVGSSCLQANFPTAHRIGLAEEEVEIHTMACWAKSLYEQSANISIGCVVPNLEKVRDKILHTFIHVFNTDHSFTLDATTLPFNISAGKTLASYPIIYSALQVLGLTTQTLKYDDISHLLHSPFIGEAENERLKRAHFDSCLRKMNLSIHSLNQLLQPAPNVSLRSVCPKLAKRLEAFIDYKKHIAKTLSPSRWVNVFINLLTILGWPGERSANSQEYQLIQRWLELLSEYQSFDHILPAQSYQKALYCLHRLAAKTIFQVQSPEAPIQILGVLEAVEIPFDYLWLMGFDDTTWPPAAKPNPFIPHRMQKSLQMPHANAEKELVYSMRLTQQLKQSAAHCLFSYALQNADNELRPSALITDLPEITLEALSLKEVISPIQRLYQTRLLECIQDNKAPAIQPDEKIRGGVSVFKQQAACPFKAFAEIRLSAQPLESLKIGLRTQDRGIIVHKTLENVWKSLKNSEALLQMDCYELSALVKTAGMDAIEKTTGKKVTATRYLSLELQRLEKLILEWLAIEKKRPAFQVVSQEMECSATIGNIPLTFRVDRVDKLEDGTHLIIDYKTGKNNQIHYWFSERPDEPQLPLYCLIDPANTIGIAFAEIHPDHLSFKGISKEDINIPSIQPITQVSHANQRDWHQQITVWQNTLNDLGTHFYEGNAQVDPKHDESCQHCQLQVFCRIHEKIEM